MANDSPSRLRILTLLSTTSSSDGDVCSGNVVVDRTRETYKSGDVISVQTEQGTLSFCKNGQSVGKIAEVKGSVRVSVQLHRCVFSRACVRTSLCVYVYDYVCARACAFGCDTFRLRARD